MNDDREPVAFEPFFGGFVLETLTVGMYGETRNAIREYIQNGFDSIRRAVDESKILAAKDGLIEIELRKDRNGLIIRDNGTGLAARNAADVLTRVGASTKSHKRHAGFRGIGRLAGIVFADKVTFTTKAVGEDVQTSVIFDGAKMRAALMPGKASNRSAQDLMSKFVSAFRVSSRDVSRHFFEVKLEGWFEAPKECVSYKEMYDFVSQIAPVPYPDEFPFADELKGAVEESRIPIEDVCIKITDGKKKSTSVTKRYGKKYKFDAGEIELSQCELYYGTSGDWWAWVGKKTESGAYSDSRVSGLRVRVRNIQIEDTAIVREIFRDNAISHVRFQDYFVGEVFVRPGALVPNARRDGFEENGDWRRIRDELSEVVAKLIKEAYRVSTKGQHSVEALTKSLNGARRELGRLRRASFEDTDKAIALSKRVTTFQSRVAKATLGADIEAAAKLQALGSAFTDIKQEALSNIGEAAAAVDREKIQHEAREELLREIRLALEDTLSPRCYAEAEEVLADRFGVE